MKKFLASATALAVVSSSAFAGVLTEEITVDLTDITYIFGGLIAFGVTWYGIKKAKSLLGA